MMEENMDCGLVGGDGELENGETDHHVDDFHRTSPQRASEALDYRTEQNAHCRFDCS